MKEKNEKKEKQKSYHTLDDGLTILSQVKKSGLTPKDGVNGRVLWTNRCCDTKGRYFSADEIRPMTDAEKAEYKKELADIREKKQEEKLDRLREEWEYICLCNHARSNYMTRYQWLECRRIVTDNPRIFLGHELNKMYGYDNDNYDKFNPGYDFFPRSDTRIIPQEEAEKLLAEWKEWFGKIGYYTESERNLVGCRLDYSKGVKGAELIEQLGVERFSRYEVYYPRITKDE